jgi:ABC-2 type transport system ATP-binding protein
MKVIVTERLTKRFHDLVAVNEISFHVYRGEIFGFLGPNGAGKSTTIRMLTTLLKPTSGKAYVAGFDVEKDPLEVRGSIGYVPQDITVDDYLTGWENMMLQASLYGLSRQEAKKRTEELLEMVGLLPFAHKKVEAYSGGMRRRLEMAEGLIHEPKVLFLDEPTLGLDVQSRFLIWEKLMELKAKGVTIFLTTHYMEEAERLCDRVAIIDHGRILALDSPRALIDAMGGDVIEFEVETLDGVGKVLADLDYKVSGNMLRVKVMKGEEVLPKILQRFTTSGIKVRRVSLSKPSLDTVYLEYTGRSLRDVEGSKDEVMRLMRTVRRMRK